jgi:SepF-like predicted cell division protein (DUF552 family)
MGILKRLFGGRKDKKEDEKPSVDPERVLVEMGVIPRAGKETVAEGEFQVTSGQGIYIKSIPLRTLDQVGQIGSEIRKGNIVILNTEYMALSKTHRVDLQRSIAQLRGICREIGGDLAQLGESYYVVVTPRFVKIWQRPTPVEEQEKTPQTADEKREDVFES